MAIDNNSVDNVSKEPVINIENVITGAVDKSANIDDESNKSAKALEELQVEADKLQIKDSKNKINTRRLLTLFFLILLAYQNYYVFRYLDKITDMQIVGDLQWLMSAIFTGTMVETYGILKIIVTQVFSQTDYRLRHENKRGSNDVQSFFSNLLNKST